MIARLQLPIKAHDRLPSQALSGNNQLRGYCKDTTFIPRRLWQRSIGLTGNEHQSRHRQNQLGESRVKISRYEKSSLQAESNEGAEVRMKGG
jgi:hypothetical protein